MRVVTQLPFGVRGCSILPQRKTDPEGFVVITTPPQPSPNQYVSAEAVRVMGNEFGMVPQERASELRFENHELKRELNEAREELERNSRLESDLAEARETIRESEEILATFKALFDEGYDVQKIKGLQKRITAFEENFGEVRDTVSEIGDALSRVHALLGKGMKEKVPA